MSAVRAAREYCIIRARTIPSTSRACASAIIGLTKSSATGEVRALNKLEDFEGNYSAIAVGAAVGKGADASSFQNNKGVVISLKQKTSGLALDLGVTAAEIKFKK